MNFNIAKKFFLTLIPFSVFVFQISFSQPAGEWTWITGDTIRGSAAIYGTMGVASVNNHPPGIYEPAQWTDRNGNFWLYGGSDFSAGTTPYGDLWKYNPLTNEWTWVNGPGIPNQPAAWGTQGIPSPANYPGARSWCISSWTDLNNNLWLMDGINTSFDYADLWMYNISTNEWTWMNGSNLAAQPSVYGVQGIPSPTNTPGSLYECAATWTDSTGMLWLFGGASHATLLGFDAMWRYNISTNEWTWMKGSGIPNTPAVYGTRGISSVSNNPGGRIIHSHWMDKANNLWIWGGGDFNTGNLYNDMWSYSPATNNWTWMSGSNAFSDSGAYYGNCIFNSSSNPSARFESRSCWTDNNNDFWLYGGFTISSYACDLWKYCVADNAWFIQNGDSATLGAVYGVQGISAPSNQPGHRGGAVSWKDAGGSLWMFGGMDTLSKGYGDMWRYIPDTNCGTCGRIFPVINFTQSDTAVCTESCIDFTNQSSNATSYQWIFAGGNPSGDTSANPTNICYSNAGTFDVTLIATNNYTSDTLTFINCITVYPQPTVPVYTQAGDTLFVQQGYSSYQWFFVSDTISGATNYFYVAQQSGNYNLAVIDSNGCLVGAGILNVIAGSPTLTLPEGEGTVFPNPTTGKFEMKYYTSKNSSAIFELINSMGEIIYREERKCKQGTNSFSFSVPVSLSLGEGRGEALYLLKVTDREKIMTTKIIIEK